MFCFAISKDAFAKPTGHLSVRMLTCLSQSLVKEGSAFEEKLNNFFLKAKAIADENHQQNGVHEDEDKGGESLALALEKAKKETYDALCDNLHVSALEDCIFCRNLC